MIKEKLADELRSRLLAFKKMPRDIVERSTDEDIIEAFNVDFDIDQKGKPVNRRVVLAGTQLADAISFSRNADQFLYHVTRLRQK